MKEHKQQKKRLDVRVCTILFFMIVGLVNVVRGVVIAWDPPAGTAVVTAGYHVYYGTSSHAYTVMVDVGTNLQATIPNVAPGVKYYFAVVAYNKDGRESLPSNEATNTSTVTGEVSGLSVLRSNNIVRISFNGQYSYQYYVLANPDLSTNWTVITNYNMTSNGVVRFSEPVSLAHRFYRIQRSRGF